MKVHIQVPANEELLTRGLIVRCAPKGYPWSEGQLGKYAKSKGVYIIHHASSIIYVGKTDSPTMTFGMRLRREFQETASARRHIYPKLEQLATPPEILVSFLTLPEVQELVQGEEVTLDAYVKIAILEQTLIGVYKPEFQTILRQAC